ncbi:MAG: hypothetical protein CM1200mP2_47450 [Planctomycetaceae bacterium]|nr:MAG: hypothetical protein CM1200mP2_47450 [Planctomycetaceae bacterium]
MTSFAPVLLPVRPATCTLAGCGQPCSTGCSLVTTVARSYCGSTTPIDNETWKGPLAPILDAFRWLELDWDEGPEVGGELGPYFQSQRDDLYRAAAERLLSEGRVYRCFDTPEEIQAARAEAEAREVPFLGTRRSLELDPETVEAYVAEGRPFVVRFQVPRDQSVVIEDAVRGRVEWDAGLIPDPVIQRGDGSPLYNFATVVDDAACGFPT